jgi:hypothetical protein
MSRYKRKRCVCGKIIYLRVDEARRAIREIPFHATYYMLRPYQCAVKQRNWQVGHDHKMYAAFTMPKPVVCTGAGCALL